MGLTSGNPDVSIGLIDGPIARDHSDLSASPIRELPSISSASCRHPDSEACKHGTSMAGILSARRGSTAPAISPECTLLVRPIFREVSQRGMQPACSDPDQLASAIMDCVGAGARILNLSLALGQHLGANERSLESALDHSLARGVITVAAAGNQNMIGSTPITRHPGVIPVAACDLLGRPSNYSNYARSIGLRGVRAPGDGVVSLGTTEMGTSVAAAMVTGAFALLWSAFPRHSASQIKLAVAQTTGRRLSVVPPLLDAWSAYRLLASKS